MGLHGRIIDITPRISSGIAVWPGDVPFERQVSLAIEAGDNIDLSAVRTTLHLGAHADAPSHYVAGGAGIEAVALEPYLGDCQVVAVAAPPGERIGPDAIAVEITTPRVLFSTGSYPDPDRFVRDFNSLSPELVDWLADRGVVLVGIDTPSVDPFNDRELVTHQALGRRGLVNLEGLVLAHVEPGIYTLVALPLPLAGADASPVRAVLIQA